MKRMILLLLLPALVAADGVEVAARDGANLQAPRWSPDGKQLSYEANFHDKKVVELHVGTPGKTFTRVTPVTRGVSSLTAGFATAPQGGQVAHELSWAPASIGRFVYAASTDALDYDLFIGGAGPLAASPGADGGPAWSPDGEQIAFTSARTGQGDVYVIDVKAADAAPRQLTTEPTSSELFIAWSPDSKQLAYVGHSTSGDNLWLIPGLDNAPVQLTSWAGTQTRPSFSPTNEWIAFYAIRETAGRFDLYVIEPTPGAEPKKLMNGVVPNAIGPVWTPDGAHLIVVLDDDSRFDPMVSVAIAAPGDPRVLALGTVGHGDLDVARGADGKLRVAYVAQGRSGDAQRDFKRLFVAELEGL